MSTTYHNPADCVPIISKKRVSAVDRDSADFVKDIYQGNVKNDRASKGL